MDKQKTWKQIIVAAAAAVLFVQPVSAEISPEFARSAETWARLRDNRLEWDEIPDLVHEYNPAVTSNWIQYQHDTAKGLTSDEYAQKLREQAQQNYDQAVSNASNDAEIAAADISRKQMLAQADAATVDGEIVRMTYEQAEAEVVRQVQEKLIAYYTAQLTQKAGELTAAYQQTQYDMILRKQSVGEATELERLNAEEVLKQAQAALITNETAVQTAKQKLLLDLGWKYDAEPEICEVPMITREQLEAIVPEKDTAAALENSYTMKINRRKLNNAQEASTKKQLETSIANGTEQIRSDLKGKYEMLLNAGAECEQQKLNISNLQETYEKTQRNYALGSASAREVETAQYNLESSVISGQMKEYELTQAYLEYQAAVNGLASAGS